MQDSANRPPITTLRITRPYGSEDELLRGDLAFFGRSSIILPGAPVRPPGSLVRFEIVLSTGAAALRGEGTVVAHHPPASGRPPGLELKLTRLDARTKSLLDQAKALRAQSASRAPEPMVSRPPAAADRSIAPRSIPPRTVPPRSAIPSPAAASNPPPIRRSSLSGPPPPVVPPSAPRLAPTGAGPVLPVDRTTETSGVRAAPAGRPPVPRFTRPHNRDEILARLRERAARLDRARVFGKRPVSE